MQAIAEPGAEIMRRNGWTMADAFSKYGPYLALAGALLPPVMVTVQAYKMAQVTPRAQPVSADAGGPTHD